MVAVLPPNGVPNMVQLGCREAIAVAARESGRSGLPSTASGAMFLVKGSDEIRLRNAKLQGRGPSTHFHRHQAWTVNSRKSGNLCCWKKSAMSPPIPGPRSFGADHGVRGMWLQDIPFNAAIQAWPGSAAQGRRNFTGSETKIGFVNHRLNRKAIFCSRGGLGWKFLNSICTKIHVFEGRAFRCAVCTF